MLGESRDAHGQWHPYTFMNTGLMSRVPSELAPLVSKVDGYRSAGRVHRIDVAGCDVVVDLLSIPKVRLAARSLALGQLRKGQSAFSGSTTMRSRTRSLRSCPSGR